MLDVKPTDQRGAALEAFARWLPIDMLTSNCHRRGGGAYRLAARYLVWWAMEPAV